MLDGICEGTAFLLDHGVMPLYSPLRPVAGTAYRLDQGLPPEVYLQLEMELFRLRLKRRFPVPGWLICSGCSYVFLDVDLDQEFGLAG